MREDNNIDRVARAFVDARKQARPLAIFPGDKPRDLHEAYATQDAALRIDGRRPIGWKVGRILSPLDGKLGANRLSGPIFAETVQWAEPIAEPEMAVFGAGFAAVEAEFLMHVCAGWSGRPPLDADAARTLVDAVHLGLEIASSPYPAINTDGPLVTISDFGNNCGLVIGRAIEEWDALDLAAIRVATFINDELVGQGEAGVLPGGPFEAVRFLLTNLSARGIAMENGFWVSTGAITGVHPVDVGARACARFTGLGDVACRIRAL